MNGETNCVFLSGFTLPSCFFIVTGINFRYTNVVFMFWFDKVNSMHIGSKVTIYCLLCVPIGLCRKETERVVSFHFKLQPELGTGWTLRCSKCSVQFFRSLGSSRFPFIFPKSHRPNCTKIICGNKMPTGCNRWVLYCKSYCLLNMFRAPLCPSSGAQEYYRVGCCLWYLVL